MSVRKDHNERYGWPHRRERARWAAQIARGGVACARCGALILPGQAWDLDHADNGNPNAYLGPSHAGSCNRSAGASKGNTARAGRSSVQPVSMCSQHWGDPSIFNGRCPHCVRLGRACRGEDAA